jgi:hypothetical protein
LTFSAPEERFDFDREAVVFWGTDRNHRIRCAVSSEVLEDHFHDDDRKILDAFRENCSAIEEIARQKYLSGRVETDGSVWVHTTDIAS